MLFFTEGSPPPPSVQTIVQRSVAATQQDWASAPDYSFHEQDRHAGGSKTYDVRIILGSPYQRLIAENGRPLSPADTEKQEHLMDQAIAQRAAESPSEREARIAQYDKERKRDHLMMLQLAKAFDFVLVGQTHLGPHSVYVLKATPKPGYHPPSLETEALTGMQGTLWIDTESFQWVKVTARVVRPVSIAGLLARVEPGTRFELEKAPVPAGIWLPVHFAMTSKAKVLSMIPRRRQQDTTFSDYRKNEPADRAPK